MATYDLTCNGCGLEFDLFVQGFLKEEDKVCPQCDSREVEQRITGFLRQSAVSDGSGSLGAGAFGGGCGCGCGH
jgi:putative FmdB family regulatory protein